MRGGAIGLPKKMLSTFLALLLASSLGAMPAYAEVEDASLSDSAEVFENASEGVEDEIIGSGAVSIKPSEDSVGSAEEEQAPVLESMEAFEDESEGLSVDVEDGFKGDEAATELLDDELDGQEKKNTEKDIDKRYGSNVGSMANGENTVYPWSTKEICEFVYDGESIIYGTLTISLYNKSRANEVTADDVRFGVGNAFDDVRTLKMGGDGYSGWFYIDCDNLVVGRQYTVFVDNMSDLRYDIKYRVKGCSGFASNFKVNGGNPISVKASDWYYLYRLYPTNSKMLSYITSVKSSKSAIAVGKGCGDRLAINAKKPGTCTLTIKTLGGATKKVKVTVRQGTPKLRWTSYELHRGQYFKNKILNNTKKVTWSSTNKKVAKVTSSGKVTAVGIGTCYIKAKVAGKTLKCKVKVTRRWPNFGAVLYNYKSQGNYFVVKYKNKGPKTVYITSGIKVKDCESRVYDRSVYLKKQVAVKPGDVKYVRFYVNGYTHSILSDFTLYYKFKYDGGVYEGHVWDEDSSFKRNGGWYATYQDDVWYANWYYLD